MVEAALRKRLSLGRIALASEARLLGLSEKEVIGEVLRRYGIMRDSVRQGLAGRELGMRLLKPSAARIFRSEARGILAVGGLHTRAAARALAALHVSNSMGIVCAAPTGGSAGVLPGVMVTLVEEKRLDDERTALALLAASAIGLIVAGRATFAAEVAGCQVEIGAAGAMGAAAVVEAAGGSAGQAADAAAISLQNTMGSVCDLVQGMCEIPCHTRNAVAASSAFVCADLILGGYANPIPLDETVDAVYASGKMLPAELRCTALGGLAVTPSALALGRKL
jgi:L-serine dehydratase